LTFEAQRLAREALDTLGLRPARLQNPILGTALEQERLIGGRDEPDLTEAHGDLLMTAVRPVPALARIHDRRADARLELEVRRFPRVVPQQPDAREGDAFPHA